MAEKKGTKIRREEIIMAALTLVANQGVKSMTIERISRIVGIVPSAIYRHFNNKSEILEAVLGMIGERMKNNAIEVNQENNDSLPFLSQNNGIHPPVPVLPSGEPGYYNEQ